ncbi:hypothetical protein MalM25_15230 [Planctomycetes bacterium MalM25]|nr:hypothetical protein MalM25_15230 [Planctomycetes bacterium MalM25]
MKACPSCGWSPESAESSAPGQPASCDLARLDSVAEAGYLVSLLEGAGIPAVARPLEAFDAARGAWSSAYAVSIAASDRQAASRVLAAESHSDFAQLAERVFDSRDSRDPVLSVNPWRMLAVLAGVLVVGVLAFDKRRVPHQPAAEPHREPDRHEPLEALISALSAEGVSLHSEAGAGPRRRLRYSPDTQSLILATDADGDGRYESRRRFAARPIDPPPVGR